MLDIQERLQRIMNTRPTTMRAAKGGYSAAHRLIVNFSNGRSAFVKVSTDPITAGWLRDEYRMYQNVQAEFMPDLLGWHDDGEKPLIVLEDLSSGLWPQTWTQDMIAAVIKTLDSVRNSHPPDGLKSLESMRDRLASWNLVASQPDSFLNLGMCSASWLNSALPTLIQSENKAVLTGSELLHLDIRSDNICFLGSRVVLVDWNWACVGNSMLDILFWLPSVALEGGPLPEQIIEGEPNLVALIAGFWAYRAGMPPPHPNSEVREIQRKQLEIALPWSAKLLGLPPPDGTATQIS
jgi:thiamine kinase-like enzyme